MKTKQSKSNSVNLAFLQKGSLGLPPAILFVSIARVFPPGNTRAILFVFSLVSLLFVFYWYYRASRRFLFELFGEIISMIIMSFILIVPGLLAIYFILGEEFLNDHETVGTLLSLAWVLAAVFSAIWATYAIEDRIKSKT